MARYAIPLTEGLAGEILDILKATVKQRGFPNAHAFWREVLQAEHHYPLSRGGFDYYWMRYQIAGIIIVDPKTKAYKIQGVDIHVAE